MQANVVSPIAMASVLTVGRRGSKSQHAAYRRSSRRRCAANFQILRRIHTAAVKITWTGSLCQSYVEVALLRELRWVVFFLGRCRPTPDVPSYLCPPPPAHDQHTESGCEYFCSLVAVPAMAQPRASCCRQRSSKRRCPVEI